MMAVLVELVYLSLDRPVVFRLQFHGDTRLR